MKTLLSVLLLLLSAPLLAQTAPVMEFKAATTTGSGSVVPILTWTTTPAATSCTASGDPAWAGTKASSGTQALAAITAAKTYNLLCTWNDQRVTVKWTPAVKNVDGSPYADPKSVRVFYGPLPTMLSGGANSGSVTVLVTSAPQTVIGPLNPGTWYFAAKSVNSADAESDPTPVVSKVVANTTATRTVGITVNPVPMPPSDLTAE